MATTKNTSITKDLSQKKLSIVREFDAPRNEVWEAWTTTMLDQWWAPKPWKAVTKSMSFKPGGLWLYYMAGPNGEKHWSRTDYETIDAENAFSAQSYFCDENGNRADTAPGSHWHNKFYSTPAGTRVEVEITFAKDADMKTMLDMGFEGGFTMGLGNLDELLSK